MRAHLGVGRWMILIGIVAVALVVFYLLFLNHSMGGPARMT
jgi:hypothetical protein